MFAGGEFLDSIISNIAGNGRPHLLFNSLKFGFSCSSTAPTKVTNDRHVTTLSEAWLDPALRNNQQCWPLPSLWNYLFPLLLEHKILPIFLLPIAFWSPLLAPALPFLPTYLLNYVILRARLSHHLFSIPLFQAFLFSLMAPNTIYMPAPPKLTSPAIVSLLGSDSQSQLPSGLLHWDVLLTKPDLLIFFPQKLFFLQMPLLSADGPTCLLTQNLQDSFLSLCSPSAFTAIKC